MRRSGLTLLVCGIATMNVSTVEAQLFGWPFGTNRSYGRHGRAHHRAKTAPNVASQTVPLPVPRPHFAGDTPPATSQAAAPGLTDTTSARHAEAPPAVPPLPPEKPPDLGPATPPSATPTVTQPSTPGPAVSPPNVPAVAPSGATNAFTPRQPAEDDACLGRLTAKKADFQRVDIGKQPDARCTVVQAVKIAGLTLPDGGTIAFPDRPVIACTTADTFTNYVGDLLAPLAKGSFGTTLTRVWTGPGLECRSRDHIFGAKLSAHGQGLAVDIARLGLADGRTVEVGLPTGATDTNFETAARAGACGYFHTVLGPGTDAYHRTHWHFDLEVRGKTGDGKYCR